MQIRSGDISSKNQFLIALSVNVNFSLQALSWPSARPSVFASGHSYSQVLCCYGEVLPVAQIDHTLRCTHFSFGLEHTEEEQNLPLQNMLPWHMDDFKLAIVKKLHTQKL